MSSEATPSERSSATPTMENRILSPYDFPRELQYQIMQMIGVKCREVCKQWKDDYEARALEPADAVKFSLLLKEYIVLYEPVQLWKECDYNQKVGRDAYKMFIRLLTPAERELYNSKKTVLRIYLGTSQDCSLCGSHYSNKCAAISYSQCLASEPYDALLVPAGTNAYSTTWIDCVISFRDAADYIRGITSVCKSGGCDSAGNLFTRVSLLGQEFMTVTGPAAFANANAHANVSVGVNTTTNNTTISVGYNDGTTVSTNNVQVFPLVGGGTTAVGTTSIGTFPSSLITEGSVLFRYAN